MNRADKMNRFVPCLWLPGKIIAMKTSSCLATKPNAQTHDPADREQLVIEYLPQVKIIARKVAYNLPRYVDLQELESAGVMGLLDAAQKFNPQRGVKFRTYAEHRIRGAILDSLRKIDWSPRSLRIIKRRFRRRIAGWS